jgi:sugar lactone lactonase YvrE
VKSNLPLVLTALQWKFPNMGSLVEKAVLGFLLSQLLSSGLARAATAPTITNQPQSQAIALGSPVTFTVGAIGTPPLRYQWRRDGDELGPATNSSLTISNVKTIDAADYSVFVWNDAGQVTSDPATLTVLSTNAPVNDLFLNRISLSGVTFSTNFSSLGATKELGEPNHAGDAGGRSLWWTWTAPIDGMVILNTTNSTFPTLVAVYTGNSLSNLTPIASSAATVGSSNQVSFQAVAGTVYQLAVDGVGGAGGNANLSLNFNGAPSITTPPVSQIASEGDSVTFFVAASGSNSPLFYQWRFNGNNLAQATNGSLFFTSVRSSDAGVYSVVVSNAAGTAISAPVTLSVVPQVPTIAAQPVGRAAAPNGNVVLSVLANAASPLSYQWRKNGQNMPTQTNTALVLSPVTVPDTGVYSVIVSNSLASVISSNAVVLVTTASYDFPYTFTTLAGQVGSVGSADGIGTNARFAYPFGVAADRTGNVYVADGNNHAIRKITPGGIVTTLPGNGEFAFPAGVALDGGGNIYVGDKENNTISKLTPEGVVSNLAGQAGPSSGSVDGAASNARFRHPEGVAVDRTGNIYVADVENQTIRKITSEGIVSTLAGLADTDGSSVDGIGNNARFFFPSGVAVDANGNVYVAEWGGHTIRKITPEGLVSTLAGSAGSPGSFDGVGNSARFQNPAGVALDDGGNLYVADEGNHTIRKITATGFVSTLAGQPGHVGNLDGVGNDALFQYPVAVALDGAGNIYVAQPYTHTIRKGVPAVPVFSSLTPIQDQTAFPGLSLTLTNNATDSSIDRKVLTFSLDPGSPLGAYIDPFTGVFNWKPDPKYSTSTNTITVRGTFYGSSNLTSTTTFQVIVADSIELQLSSTALPAGHEASVMVDAKFHTLPDRGVTNLSFVLAYPANLIRNLNIIPVSSNAATASIDPIDTSHARITIEAAAGEMFTQTQRLARITFTGNQIIASSAGIVSAENVEAKENDGNPIPAVITWSGRVMVAGRIPFLDARLSATSGREFVLFGEAGTKYQIESRTNLFGPDTWRPVSLVTLPDYFQAETNVDQTSAMIFYRAKIAE